MCVCGIAGTNKFNPDYNPLTKLLSDSVEMVIEVTTTSAVPDQRLGMGTPPGVSRAVKTFCPCARGVPAALRPSHAAAAQPPAFRFTAGQLDVIGHQLAERGELRDAVAILTFNAGLFADTPGVLESLGETQLLANDVAAALDIYRRALSKFPNGCERARWCGISSV